ncbi:MAG: WbqC family protein [Candidatus Bathyarchaeota archaeon]|nr:WbqC family protein [Chloroflexota bacterium]MCL5877495.1 WbqC family protein [Candidatus Bathyarchaeota archaeon]
MNRVILKQSDSTPISKTQPQQVLQPEVLQLDGTLILSGHQPTLLPYPGFFYRMYHSNVMDICPYDPLSRHSDRYQHRVKIGKDTQWRWLTLPIEASSTNSIMEAKLKTHLLAERWGKLEHVYHKYPLWDDYKGELKEIFFSYQYLWELNLRLILWLRDILGIKTYLSISYGSEGCDTTERVASQFSNYGSVVYLAGKGSMEYLDMQKYERLTQSTIALVTYTPPTPFSTVSILTPLLMYPPQRVLEILNIRREPIKVIVNGAEYSVNYLNS